MKNWKISDASPTRIIDAKSGALIADLTGLMDAENNTKAICDAMNSIPEWQNAMEVALAELKSDGRSNLSSDGVELLESALLKI